eukprot:scaffold203288_cov10-Prasinocladus_malaysianus.AAC.1
MVSTRTRTQTGTCTGTNIRNGCRTSSNFSSHTIRFSYNTRTVGTAWPSLFSLFWQITDE